MILRAPGTHSVEFDQPVAVIGDIHGRSDQLAALLDQLGDLRIVVAGDLCDRGPDTRGVLDLLISRQALGVRGNHEEWFSKFMSGHGFERYALGPVMGGRNTLGSYGVDMGRIEGIAAQWEMVPRAHETFINSLGTAMDLRVGGESFWIIHAGIPLFRNTGDVPSEAIVPWMAQHHPDSLLWGNTQPEDMQRVDRTVVMGHMIQPRPIDLGHVIAIDTGAGTLPMGPLTAVVLPERRFVSVYPD